MVLQTFALYRNECLPDQPQAGTASARDIYLLVTCPPVPFGTRYTFVTVRDGVRCTIGIGRAQSKCPSLNLADIRHRGACLGITEVHVIR